MTTAEKGAWGLAAGLGLTVIAGVALTLRRGGSLGAVEQMPGGGTTVTGRDVPLFRLMALKHMLHLETVGLKRRGASAYSIIKREFGLRGDKKAVLEQFTRLVNAAKAAHKGPMV